MVGFGPKSPQSEQLSPATGLRGFCEGEVERTRGVVEEYVSRGNGPANQLHPCERKWDGIQRAMGIAEGLAAIKATVEVAKLTSELVNRPNIDADKVRSNLSELLIHAFNAQVSLLEGQQQISDLQSQLDDKRALEALRLDVEYVADGQFFVRKSEKAAGRLIAYCPLCWTDAPHKLIPLQKLDDRGQYRCNLHRVTYHTERYQAHVNRPLYSRSDYPG